MKWKYTRQQLLKMYDSYSYRDKCIILYNALDVMQQYNGRSRWSCIFIAMGYKEMSDYWVKEEQ